MNIVFYDLTFLVLFTLFVVGFLRKNRKNLGKDKMLGLPVYLYRSSWGMKEIDKTAKKFSKLLHFIKYISISVGFLLMGAIIYILGKSVYIYAVFPQITQTIKAPPITPLIPYFPQLFGMQSFFPPFYFTYFIVALAIVAIVHEFSHGIFMRLYNIKIKSTGFAFLGPFLGAFVEQDEKSFTKSKNIAQMSTLSAGVFANVIFALIFFGLLVGWFFLALQPGGYQFNSYAYSVIPMASITGMTNLSNGMTQIVSGNQSYLLDDKTKIQLETNATYIIAYNDAPAIKAELKGAISELNGEKIRSQQDLRNFLENSKPGDNVTIKTKENGKINEYNISLGLNPANPGIGFLGVGSDVSSQKGVVSAFIKLFTSFRDPNILYEPKFDGQLVVFIYDLFWWVMIINFLVAIFNMLPAGPFDGGRFLYLAILSTIKSEKISKNIYKGVNALMALIFILLMVFWFVSFF